MLEETIRKHALKNAHEYGKADQKGIVGKVIAEFPDAKKDMQKTMDQIKKAIISVNKMKKAQIEEELGNYSFAEKKPETERKFRIAGAEDGKVVTRFLPEPNGYLHIGHAKAAVLSSELAKQYAGKCIIRFDDTNPEAEAQEFVDAIKRSLEWLGLEFANETYTSDKMQQLYKFAEKMLILDRAYVCCCKKEDINRNRYSKTECACRGRRGGEHFHLWEKMIAGDVEEGQLILRFKGDMKSENTAMRDPTLFRIIKSEHYRQGKKYSCWPTYDFEVSISDSLDGITHALRSKEYELRDELYYAILDAVNLRKPVVYDFSRLNIRGTMLSKRLIKPLIEKKQVLGWDDPRLPTLDGLKKRGILPKAIKEFVLRQGLSKVESEPEFEDLLAINRRLLENATRHSVFVPEPVKLKISGMPENLELTGIKSNLKKHLEIIIPGKDAAEMKPKETVRLRQLADVKIATKHKAGIDAEFVAPAEKPPEKRVQWLLDDERERIGCEVMEIGPLLDGRGEFNGEGLKIAKGFCSTDCLQLKEGETVHFDRYGFCKLDRKENGKLIFILSC
ncbi:MAG: glutamate--tRNA ligase [Candidatus Micrarchaeota archaeon]